MSAACSSLRVMGALVWAGGFLWAGAASARAAETPWNRHLVFSGAHNTTAVAGDFSGDGLPDVISNFGGATRLFVAPDYHEVVLDQRPDHDCIHSETFDVDGDGDLDFVGARYSPGLVYWLEQPARPLDEPWTYRVADDELNGIHGLLAGDVDGDGRTDLLANSGQPVGPWANSAAYLRVPDDPRAAERWERVLFADRDAPGLSHYLGLGDLNGDGRADVTLAAKGGPQAEPGTGAWFAWWEQPSQGGPWTKHLIATGQSGATNILPADVNGDGQMDVVATRGHDRGVLWFAGPDWTAHVIHADLLEPHCLVVADLDLDGDRDAATCGYGDRQAWWYENDGRGQFALHLVALDQAAYDLRAADLDLDGDLDLLIAGQQSQNIAWYENPGR